MDTKKNRALVKGGVGGAGEVQIGDYVRSYDFPDRGPDHREECYVEGVVQAIDEPRPEREPPVMWKTYAILVELDVFGGEVNLDTPRDDIANQCTRIGQVVHPPINGLDQTTPGAKTAFVFPAIRPIARMTQSLLRGRTLNFQHAAKAAGLTLAVASWVIRGNPSRFQVNQRSAGGGCEYPVVSLQPDTITVSTPDAPE